MEGRGWACNIVCVLSDSTVFLPGWHILHHKRRVLRRAPVAVGMIILVNTRILDWSGVLAHTVYLESRRAG